MKYSVIMSIYNEPLKYIKSSIDSILSQTLKNFEFIIVIDNPDREDVYDILQTYLAS
ncbi:TPA: glycosyltransferase, partial [Streptococcus agalactiae]|nr:glycosyltransferase [Streptococcus agalactiae]